jgi:Fic family protein
LSDFISQNKGLYYDNLTRVRDRNDLNQWLRFFLVGVRQTAEHAADTFQKILALKSKIEAERLPQLGKRMLLGQQLLRELYKKPVTNSQHTAQMLNVAASTANRLIDEFQRLGILHEKTGYRRNRMFVFKEYIQLFQKNV